MKKFNIEQIFETLEDKYDIFKYTHNKIPKEQWNDLIA